MIDLQTFEGDLYLFETSDGGEIKIEDGLFVPCRNFDTAVYISLFGGNSDDAGSVKNKNEWWGNLLPVSREYEKMTSRFGAYIKACPMSSKNIAAAESCALMDLNWIIEEKIADKIIVKGSAGRGNEFNLKISINAAGNSIYENTYSLFWKVGIYGRV